MDKPDEDDSKAARHALWLTTTLKRHYDASGNATSPDSASHIHIALDALEDDASARNTARLLSKNMPPTSDANTALTHWWLSSLRTDATITPWQRLSELASGADHAHTPKLIAAYEAQLGSLLTSPVTAQTAITYSLKQLELGNKLKPATHEAIENNASRLASITPDVALFPLLQHAHEYALPKLREATKNQLHRAGPAALANWYDQARKLDNSAALCKDLSAAYQSNLRLLTQTAPAAAWACIEALNHRWGKGQPAILTQAATPVQDVFNAYAIAEPRRAAAICASDIKAEASTTERLAALENAQEKANGLQPVAQILFLAHLHTRLMFEPDLARPSREQLLALYKTYPDAGVTETLNSLAQGDDVLQSHLSPPAVLAPLQLLPKPAMGVLGHLRRWLLPHKP